MLAPPVAKAQTKAAARPPAKSTGQHAMPFRGNAPGSRRVGGAGATTTTAPKGEGPISWNFAKIPLFEPGRASRPQETALLPAAALPTQNLAVGRIDDAGERAADRVADRIMRMPISEASSAPALPQIKCETTGSTGEEASALQAQGTGAPQTAVGQAPGIVHDVLRSPGQPLDTTTREFMEPRFGHDFSRIRIHADPTAARAAMALRAEAFTVGSHIAFARGRFATGSANGRRLVAHELTHTIQQAATTPYIALSPDNKEVPAPGSSAFTGAVLGTDRNEKQILVKREVGETQGYDDRLQAIAVARLTKAEPSAVAQDRNGKWHAFETASGINVEDASANDPRASVKAASVPFKGVSILPSLAGIDESRKRVDELKAKLVRLDKLEADWKSDPTFRELVKGSDKPFLEAIEVERENTKKRLQQANQTRAEYIFGVPGSEISFNIHSSQRVPGKINLTAEPDRGATSDARHGPVAGQGGIDFRPGLITAFDIDAKDLDTPERAQGALFHEVSHLKDYELAQQWVARYQQETGHMFVGGPGLKPFMDWINDQARKKPPRLSAADAELVVDEAADASATTEARANIRTFLTYFRSGLFDAATTALVNYATALPPGRVYGAPPPGSPVLAELTNELGAAYRHATKLQKAQFDAAIAAAKKANPTAWISKLDRAK